MPPFRPRRARPPLDRERLHELALAYVGRFATTRAKLVAYLARKVRERGFAEGDPGIAEIAERFAASGLVDDRAYAGAKAESLTRRGYGARRVASALRQAGVADEDGADALAEADREAFAAALRFARRRRIGPFATAAGDIKAREKAIAAMVRAGHSLGLALTIAGKGPGEIPSEDEAERKY